MDGEEDFRKLLSNIENNLNNINGKCFNKKLKNIKKDYLNLKNIIEGYIGKSGGGTYKKKKIRKNMTKKNKKIIQVKI